MEIKDFIEGCRLSLHTTFEFFLSLIPAHPSETKASPERLFNITENGSFLVFLFMSTSTNEKGNHLDTRYYCGNSLISADGTPKSAQIGEPRSISQLFVIPAVFLL